MSGMIEGIGNKINLLNDGLHKIGTGDYSVKDFKKLLFNPDGKVAGGPEPDNSKVSVFLDPGVAKTVGAALH